MHIRFRDLALSALLLCAGSTAASAAESYDTCTGFINSVPAVISTQGTWCLRQDLSTAIGTGNAITIATNNVTLDCNNFKLGGLPAGAGTDARGIGANDRSNITVRRCNVRGFVCGILIDHAPGVISGGHVIENNRLDGNKSAAIFVRGDNSTIRGNIALDTGGTTIDSGTMAILTFGKVDVIDNTISGVYANDTSSSWYYVFGINAYTSASGVKIGAGTISGNRVSNLYTQTAGKQVTAINLAGTGGGGFVVNNQISGNGQATSFGITCGVNRHIARGNTIGGVAAAMTGCADAGGNVVVPP